MRTLFPTFRTLTGSTAVFLLFQTAALATDSPQQSASTVTPLRVLTFEPTPQAAPAADAPAGVEADAPQAETGVEAGVDAGVEALHLPSAASDTSADQAAAQPGDATERGPIFAGPAGPTAAAEALLDALGQAPAHALPAGRYDVVSLEAQARTLEGAADPAAREAFERAMTRSYLAYARDLTSGVLEPSKVDSELKLKLHRPDPEALLDGLARASDPAAFLAGLAPSDPEYAALQAQLARLGDIVRGGGWGEPVPEGRTLRAGESGPRVEALRRRLIAMGDLSGAAGGGDSAVMAVNSVANDAAQPVALTDPWVYDETLVAAVKHFQERHGLNTDGVVGPATLAALNTSAADRLRSVAVNLERMRWLNRDLGRSRVMVNLAGFTMRLIEDGQETFASRIVVGDPDHHTPEFSDEIEHMVVNPSWNVPSSIAVKEILPKLRQDPTYLARNNMTLVGADPWYIDWWNVTPGNFPGRIKQLPGDDNALGKVKFMFPNDNAVYLHDTPSKSLFAKDMRAFSHGCMRVEKPFEFARILLRGQESDPTAAFDRLLRSGKERWVSLKEHIPVHITYRTAWIEPDGSEQFRSDIYGRDRKVMAALEEAGVRLDI